ncbi:nucleotidyltransferase domain-containing protein [Natrialba asiatica]|uniref:Nucleotidyltransferase n=1 Tax=Natrialba asiatica (strain ATCC 700177 / DSM 12278 / JCM 9576 / FERM P-10747 / NBRC 102637 / 172P1) TaxID=29540 RepID=M0ALW3_NATA1|nr:nucleotidyltransferase domain-containing protein [Natrialba asiatica]ELY98907.1 nucleotidyltransferase [Natrialba asiatica DSM 12278]
MSPPPSVPASVRERIESHLAAIERDRDVTIIVAVARGSRAWGGASSASDYDVGFVFAPSDLSRYAHLEGPPETIVEERRGGETVAGNATSAAAEIDYDYQGWDVRKFARLLVNSNDGAIDLLRSPIRYRLACERAVLDDLRSYVERTYNPMDLYHAYRGIATSNYRKYVSNHLVRADDELFPIIEETADGYVVEAADGAGESDEAGRRRSEGKGEGTMYVADDDERFSTTQTKPTVKRNLTICRAAMAARHLQTTGERGDHDLPALAFETFLDDQAPAVFERERIALARTLLERKRRGEGDAHIGDPVGREFATPPAELDPAVHVRAGPDAARVDEFVDELLAAVE